MISQFLIINPADIFYKKMTNERHYYICQLANGSAGLFLEKADWKLDASEAQSVNVAALRTTISNQIRKVMNALYSTQISLTDLNSNGFEKVVDVLTENAINGSTVLTQSQQQSFGEQLSKGLKDFDDNLIQQVYGKKKHAYKVPNVTELQKLVMISEANGSLQKDSAVF
jgi:hypothetical protein